MKKLTSPSAMTGARCSQLDGLYDQPGGMSGPANIRMPGIPGTRIEKAIASAPASVSIRNASGSDDQKTSGAKSSQIPTAQVAQRMMARSGEIDRKPRTTSSRPQAMSFQTIAVSS